ncbi:hypothetical protein SUGI_0224400 [Cryptomeria japonica]|uniref:uncharacterized protein LOC131037323 n=1 Tax=Cryptomeria japonica TaxID=3369 RepID=UPI002408BFDC|nr:uncharacterized protein LOC131037323 [Cryptomeria japonica]GLJ14038.1 hypothetical protein SUGI_0224400 [Cryptomeria japonica]
MESLEPVQREGSPEGDGNLSASATLARDAAGLFQSGHYQECIGVLNQLLQKKEDDTKVLHNIAVAEYYSHGCTDPQKLLEVLDKVKKKNEELARAAGDQVEGISNNSNNSSTLVPKSSSVPGAQQASTSSNSDGVTYLEEYDTSIATLNTAVILYNLQHYENAMSVLEPVYQNIEPIDETTALRICLLMLDIALASHEAAKAADVVQYMEKAFVFGYVAESGSNVQYQSTNQPLKPSSTPVNLTVAEAASGAAIMNTSTAPVAIVNNESSLTRTLSDEACDYEALLSTFDSDSQNLGRSSAPLSISTDLARPTVERPAPANDLKLQLHLYKVRLLLLTRNLKATKREVKLAMHIARGRDSSTELLLKAQLEYCRGNHRKAIKLLTTCSSRAEQGMSCMLWNNLGCIHHKLRKDNIAAIYFKKAYQSIASLGAEQPLNLSKFSQDKSQSIMYNCGMLHLMRGNPTVAAQCFQLACCLYYNQPLLWLRLAECCNSAQEKGLLKMPKSDSSVREDCLKVNVFGDGRWRHIVLQDGITTPFSSESKSDSDEGFDNLSPFIPVEETFFQLGQPVKLSMLFARQCLQMSLWLLKRNDNSLIESVLSTEKTEDEDSNQATVGFRNHNQNSTSTGESRGASNTTAGLTNQVNANGDAKESKGNTGSGNAISSSVDTYEEMRRKENMLVTQAVLASLAYVELSLENPLKALTTAELLLQQPMYSREYIYLARIYAAEALCHLNRIKEAAEQLSVCMEEGNSIDLAVNANEDGHKWRSGENSEASGDGEDNSVVYHPSLAGNLAESQNISHITGGRARCSLYVNLAAVSAMQGDFQQAHQYSTQAVSLMPTSTMAVLSVVYVELLEGKTHEAISKLKQYRHLHVASPTIVS